MARYFVDRISGLFSKKCLFVKKKIKRFCQENRHLFDTYNNSEARDIHRVCENKRNP